MKWRVDSPVDDRLLVLIVALTVAGIVAVFSASYPTAGRPLSDGTPGNPYKFLTLQAAYAGVGALFALLFAYFPPERFRRWAGFAFVVGVVLMLLVFVPGVGVKMGGAWRWIRLGRFVFQPSEFAKVGLLLFVAWRVSMVKDWAREQARTFVVCIAAAALVAGLCVVQRDLGSAVVIFVVALATLYFAGVRTSLLGLAFSAASVLGFYFAWSEPYRRERLLAFLHPFQDTGDTSYHVARMLITLARGGLFGQGLGLSREKWMALPARHTDSIFCVIGGELGLIGAAALVVAFLFLVRRAAFLARRQPDAFSAVLTVGIASVIGIQAFINMGVACGLLPCTGITLPFISSGGSSLVCTLAASGILLSLSRQAPPQERANAARGTAPAPGRGRDR